ncbi:TonB-dependent receptor domain-containing protein [Flavobacterium aquidurense]|uniref:TonB-dependent receptor n=1 Tax=Flavobacterium aquidurense TaxID=362413 RepID=UPI0028628F84|nr:TonB-dependent receptor [Flavobacterium aquidurense]MDR7370251.1 TonB-dependent receptor [Flavobacterium aquidurense]
MKKITLLFIFTFCFFLTVSAKASTIKGNVYDAETGEPLVGVLVSLAKSNQNFITGLDGSFKLSELSSGTYTLKISYASYVSISKEITIDNENSQNLKFYLQPESNSLDEVIVDSEGRGNGEHTARRLEKEYSQVVNIVSGKAIEISPDLTVANVIQRVSGVSIERNSNGDGQYAIIRGMDKRYNYTEVNGVKIPSPDNKYRYVPLDIFPSDLLDRLEVYKTLTPNMEGDAIGGVVNMVMKDAPAAKPLFSVNISEGYSQMFFDRKFMAYGFNEIHKKSPYEVNPKGYQATSQDFPKGTLAYTYPTLVPNFLANISLGKRFFDNKFGVLLAGSFQNSYRGSNSTIYNTQLVGTDEYASIVNKNSREYSEQQKRYGVQGKADYKFNPSNKISLYSVFLNLDNIQTRNTLTTDYTSEYHPEIGNAKLLYATRTRFTRQQIYNNTLQGDNALLNDKFKIHWSAAYSFASNEVPDNTNINVNGEEKNYVSTRTKLAINPVTHRWERNTDEDLAGYLDLTYTLPLFGGNIDLSAGGLYRDKQRSSFYNNYTLAPTNPNATYGTDFTDYTQIDLIVTNPTGAVSNPLTYDASEKTAAGYGMFNFKTEKWQAIGGIRIENTDQGYNLLFPAGEPRPTGNQIYTYTLPSLTLKYFLSSKQQLHASYFRSLNRPGFYEIVPSKVVNEEYQERGNPDLKPAVADNYDFRYEFFPKAGSQLFLGTFYKNIKDPIEYTFLADATRGQDTYYSPGNFGTAKNFGIELDYITFFNKIGFKVNYTYTDSKITTPKDKKVLDDNGNLQKISVMQTRPLYGQSAHIGNASILYKDGKKGWDAQLSAAYTGPRINTVSQFVNNDLWQEGFVQMDASVEKQFKSKFSIYIKANNLLNTPHKLFIKGTNPANATIAENNLEYNGRTLIRDDYYGQSYLIGVRYKY